MDAKEVGVLIIGGILGWYVVRHWQRTGKVF